MNRNTNDVREAREMLLNTAKVFKDKDMPGLSRLLICIEGIIAGGSVIDLTIDIQNIAILSSYCSVQSNFVPKEIKDALLSDGTKANIFKKEILKAMILHKN